VRLGAAWRELEDGLPPDWREVDVRLVLEERNQAARAAALLGPLQPIVSSDYSLGFRVGRDGGGPQPEMVERLLELVDRERLHGTLEVGTRGDEETAEAPPPGQSLVESWDSALESLPADWSDLFAEVELDSSDYLERAALHTAPINPRRDGGLVVLQFRCARRFGYGAAPEMVRRSLERCDEDGISGRVRILRVLSDTRPVQTQGPVWQLGGRTV
jgi:hypothetical protein